MMKRTRLVFLNALPLNSISLNRFYIDVRRIDIETMNYIVKKAKSTDSEILNYIRHESTIRLINSLFGLNLSINPGLYQWQEGDELLIITLKKPVRGQEAVEVTIDDLDMFYAYISEVCY